MTETIFDASILDAAKARRRVEDEQLRQQVLQRTLDFLDEFGSRHELGGVILFGSLIAPGRFGTHSDVDVAVDGIDPALFFDLMASLSLALGRDVDLVDLSQCHFAERIRQKGVRWTKKC
ncbi:MAG: nucleotidyltransferase domain-containing protein [Chloroflexi bacterium]|nr:nucleotidyltransferase domain-containing protein [Chloroflexota bacterium]